MYTFYPEDGAKEWIVSPGFPVVDRDGRTVGLPAGSYAVQAKDSHRVPTNIVTADVFGGSDLTIWHQSHARHAQDAQCQEGWQPSWAQWPNAGTGGFVCNRQIYAYYPDEPVR